MPPLALTGERTLPDVPEENYWYRRHLAVYEWIAARAAGACGSPTWPAARATAPTCWPARAAEVVGVDANPEAHEHARLRYRRPNLRFERDLVEQFAEPCDAIVFLQTIEHVERPGELLAPLRASWRRSSYVSTPNRLTLAPPGAEKSDNPWHLREYTIEEYRELLEPRFARVEVLGLFHARKLRAHELAIKLGWDRVHKRPAHHQALLRPLHRRRSRPRDFALRRGRPGRRAGLPRGLPA